MHAASYLVLETPRAGNMGYRRLVSVGGLSQTNLTEALREVQKSGTGGDAVEVARTVRQPTVAGVAGREGTERLVLVHSGLGRASPEVIATLRDRLESLLTNEASALVQMSETWTQARDLLTIGHPDIDDWHGQLITLLPMNLQEPTPVSGTGEAQAESHLSSPKHLKTHPRISTNIIIVFAAGCAILILTGVLFFYPRDPAKQEGISKQEISIAEDCWEALNELFAFYEASQADSSLKGAMNRARKALDEEPPLDSANRRIIIDEWASAISDRSVDNLKQAGLFSDPPILSTYDQNMRFNRFIETHRKLLPIEASQRQQNAGK